MGEGVGSVQRGQEGGGNEVEAKGKVYKVLLDVLLKTMANHNCLKD